MQNPQQTIKQLQAAIQKQDHGQVLKLSTTLTRENPQDAQYKQCYIISSIREKQFNELAAGVFKDKPQDKTQEKLFYYYLYASGQFTRCVELLAQTKDAALMLLLAQSYFKTLQYQKSISIMSDLLKSQKMSPQQKQQYLVNLLAASSSTKSPKTQQFQSQINQNSCKQMFYNYSLYLYFIGEKEKALKFLEYFQKALQKGDEVDRVTVKLFRDYMLFTSGQPGLNREKYLEQYKNLLKQSKVLDQNLQCVVTNNLLYLANTPEGHNQYYKSLQQFHDPKTKLSLLQSIVLRINRLSHLNRKNKTHDAHKIITQLGSNNYLSSFATSITNQYEINKYYVYKKNKDLANAQKYVRTIMENNLNLGFCLLVDLCQETGNTRAIIDVLQILAKTQNQHAKNYIFSLMIKDTKLFSQYSQYLDDLIKKSQETKTLQILLKLYEQKQDKSKQIMIYNRILEINPKNSIARVGLAQVYLENHQLLKAQQLLKGIQRPSQITDINYLQYIQKNIHISKKQQTATVTEQQKKAPQKKRIKKKRRIRLPKNVQKPTPGFKPDPQRWLPKWQRKGYKKKGKKGGNKTQGLSTVGMEEKNIFNANNSTSAKEVTKDSKKRR